MPYHTKRNDTRPVWDVTLQERDPAVADPNAPNAWRAINLTTATSVRLVMKSGSTVVSRAATFVDQVTGKIRVTFQAADMAVAGDYQGEFEITWTDGGIETVPKVGYESVTIEQDLS